MFQGMFWSYKEVSMCVNTYSEMSMAYDSGRNKLQQRGSYGPLPLRPEGAENMSLGSQVPDLHCKIAKGRIL
jgi:hypothetical protein